MTPPRGLRKTRVAFHVLAALMHGRARNWISNLPDDVEVVHVGEDLERQSTVLVVLSSADWEGPEEGGLVPDVLIILRDL
jgi:hypothetical protein